MPRQDEKKGRLEQRIKRLSEVEPFSYTFGVEIELVSTLTQSMTAELISRLYNEKFGQELNIQSEGYNHINVRGNDAKWKIVGDASVHGIANYNFGMEIVSPILEGVEGLERFQRVYETLERLAIAKKVDVHRGCGTHIHLGTEGVPLENIRRFAMNYYRSESAIDLLVPPSRRESKNSYCASNISDRNSGKNTDYKSVASAMATLSTLNLNESKRQEGLRKLSDIHYTRYLKLNLTSLRSHKTIEVRHFGGTVNSAKAVGWLKFLDYMYRMSRTQVAFKQPVSDRNCEAKGNFRRLTAWLDADKKVQDWAKGRKKELEQNDARLRRNARRRQRYAQNRRAD